jgi:hypothetical protein
MYKNIAAVNGKTRLQQETWFKTIKYMYKNTKRRLNLMFTLSVFVVMIMLVTMRAALQILTH